MRTLRLIFVIVVLAGSAACNGDPQSPPRDDGDGEAALSLWTANLEHLLPEHNWREFVERATEGGTAPDLVFLSELTRSQSNEVAHYLQVVTGEPYVFEHAPIGNNAVVWRVHRFGPEPDGDPLLWEPFGASGCTEPSRTDPSEVVGVRLTDRTTTVPVVAVAVHWGRTWAAECMDKNLTALDEQIDARWPARPFTVVAGDLNAHPDKQPVPGEPGVETLESGRETDPDCWYRSFSALHDQALRVTRADEDDRDCADNAHYSDDADSYVDAVSVAHDPQSLCDQWTSVHGKPVAGGSSCTDLNDDGLRDRGRIDYIWLRWEDDPGDPLTLSASDAAELIARAGADQVCILESCAAERYSDHRAVWAEVSVSP